MRAIERISVYLFVRVRTKIVEFKHKMQFLIKFKKNTPSDFAVDSSFGLRPLPYGILILQGCFLDE